MKSEAELIELATIATGKGMTYEQFMYSDYLYGDEKEIDNVWEYVEEIEENGRQAFREKYKSFKMYGGF